MEDAHISILDYAPSTALFGVMDGHGGQEVALYVQDRLPKAIKDNPLFHERKWSELFLTIFKELDQSLLSQEAQKALISYATPAPPGEVKYVSENEIYRYVGCTACIAMITDSELIVANAGDSRCIACIEGTAVELSKDHKPELEEEKERIKKANGFIENNRVNGNLNLSRCIGDHEYKRDKTIKFEEQLLVSVPDVKIMKITPGIEFVVVACDGIWEALESQAVVDFVKAKLSKEDKMSNIIDQLFESIISTDTVKTPIGCDNMTCIVIQFKK